MARIAIAALACMALMVEVSAKNKTAFSFNTSTDHHKIPGSLVFTADCCLTSYQAESGAQSALSKRVGVDASAIKVEAAKSRRLGEQEKTEARRLADTWTITYEIYVALDAAEDIKAKARSIEDAAGTSLVQDTLQQDLIAVGASSAVGFSVSITTLASDADAIAAAEEEADGAHALSCNFLLALAAYLFAYTA